MSDDCTLFSQNLPLSEDPERRKSEKAWLTKALEADKGTERKTYNFLRKMGLKLMDPDDYVGWTHFEWGFQEEDALWIHSQTEGNINNVASLVQGFLRHFNYKSIFTMPWANTSAKPYIGAFGGGVIAVTADVILAHSTYHTGQLLEVIVKKEQRRLRRLAKEK